jgi:hypothetical protein
LLRTVGLSGGVVEAGGERKELLDGCLLSLGLILLLNALLEDIVLLDLLVEHDSDLIDLNILLEEGTRKKNVSSNLLKLTLCLRS